MKTLAFVIPWFSANISGGAETALRDLTQHLAAVGVNLEILTTCVEKFDSDWSLNYFQPGIEEINGIPVRRFPADPCSATAFGKVNIKLMRGERIEGDDETIFLNEIVNSDALYDYIRTHRDEYGLFVFIPYMFGTTYFGSAAAGEKAVLIPCFHDESYAYMHSFAERFSRVRGMAFLSQPESDLAHKLYDLSGVDARVMGLGVEDIPGDAARFRKKYGIEGPFLLYAGRKDSGKKVDLLLEHFAEYKRTHKSPLQLVLIGGGEIKIPKSVAHAVHDLGFVDKQDKYDAYAAATVFCQPSWFESFSIVIMESWLAGRPVMVSKQCAVTSNFVQESQGGVVFSNYDEFAAGLDRILADGAAADQMGQSGRRYVQQHFIWPEVTTRYKAFFEQLSESYPACEP